AFCVDAFLQGLCQIGAAEPSVVTHHKCFDALRLGSLGQGSAQQAGELWVDLIWHCATNIVSLENRIRQGVAGCHVVSFFVMKNSGIQYLKPVCSISAFCARRPWDYCTAAQGLK